MNKYYKNIIIGVIVFVSMLLIIGASYAYFATKIVGNEDAELMKLTSGTIELTFVDDNTISLPNAKPGDSNYKTFTVENTGTLNDDYTYNIKLVDVNTSFLQEDLEYTLQEYTNDSYTDLKSNGVNRTGFINQEMLNEKNEMYLAVNIGRPEKQQFHYYKLTITFKDLEDVNQNYNQGAIFNGKINVDDNKDANVYSKVKSFSEIMQVDNETIFNDDPNNNLRYAGVDPNNYIWFNCDSYDDLTQITAEQKCEKWRIIGLFNNITKTEGGEENLVKIIRADIIGNIAWDSARKNNWSTSSLQLGLNGPYFNGDNSSWITSSEYTSSYGKNTIDNSYKSITNDTKGMIEKVRWNIGGSSSKNITSAQFYTAERGSIAPSGAQATWDGHVGLMYPSDYGYATSGLLSSEESNRKGCLNQALSNWNSGSYKLNCIQNSWLFDPNKNQWALIPNPSFSYSEFFLYYDGSINYTDRGDLISGVRPTLYLKSNVKIKSGDGNGSSTEPYILMQ